MFIKQIIDIVENLKKSFSLVGLHHPLHAPMISSLLHLVGLRPRVYYTLTNFRGGGKAPLPPPPPQYANAIKHF